MQLLATNVKQNGQRIVVYTTAALATYSGIVSLHVKESEKFPH